MGIFGNDQEQDERLDSIEHWLQGLTRVVQQHQLKTAKLQLDLLQLQAKLDEKLTRDDFDPVIMQVSEKLSEARTAAREAAEAASESWSSFQDEAASALTELDDELERAAKEMKLD
jgi:hypothetical protein